MNRKIIATAIMFIMLLTSVSVIACTDDSDAASGGTAYNTFKLRSGGVSIETTDSYTSSSERTYCFVAGSEEDNQMKDYLRYGNVSCPTPLGSSKSGATYSVYELYTGTGSFLSKDILAFTVAKDGDVPIKISSTMKVSLNGDSGKTNIDTVREMKAGDRILIQPGVENSELDFKKYWFSITYEIGNVVLSESDSLPDVYLMYGVTGVTIGLVLLGMLVCRRHPLSKKDPSKVGRHKFPLGTVMTLLVVGVVVAAGVNLYNSDSGGKDLRSLDIKEGLTFEITSDNGISTTRTVYTVTGVDENDIVSFTQETYKNGSSTPTTITSSAKKTLFEKYGLNYEGSTTDLMRAMERSFPSIKMSKEVLDTGFGNMYCDKYVCERSTGSGDYTYTLYVYHGYLVKQITEKAGSMTSEVMALTALSYK